MIGVFTKYLCLTELKIKLPRLDLLLTIAPSAARTGLQGYSPNGQNGIPPHIISNS